MVYYIVAPSKSPLLLHWSTKNINIQHCCYYQTFTTNGRLPARTAINIVKHTSFSRPMAKEEAGWLQAARLVSGLQGSHLCCWAFQGVNSCQARFLQFLYPLYPTVESTVGSSAKHVWSLIIILRISTVLVELLLSAQKLETIQRKEWVVE